MFSLRLWPQGDRFLIASIDDHAKDLSGISGTRKTHCLYEELLANPIPIRVIANATKTKIARLTRESGSEKFI